MNLTQRQLKIFVTVARSENLQEAGKAIHMSQSGITRALQELESQLGCDLFLRTSKKSLKMTPQGEFFLRAASNWICEIEAVAADIRNFGKANEASITIAAGAAFCGLLASDFLNELSRVAPHLHVKVIESHSDTITRLIDSGEADIGIGTPRGRADHYKMTNLMSAPLGFLYSNLNTDIAEVAHQYVKINPEIAEVSYNGSFYVLLVDRNDGKPEIKGLTLVSSITIQITMAHAGHVSIMSALGASHPLIRECTFLPLEPRKNRVLSIFSRKSFIDATYGSILVKCIASILERRFPFLHPSIRVEIPEDHR